jgi:hypothetical protein
MQLIAKYKGIASEEHGLEIWLTREAIEKSFFKQCS